MSRIVSADWPMFRGDPAGQGVATSVLPVDLKVLWTFRAKERAFEATAALVDGVVYVGDADGTFYAIDLRTGEKRWTYQAEIGFLASAAVRRGRVFVGDSDGVFHCLDAKTGKSIWKYVAEDAITSSANFYQESILFGSQDGTLARLRMADGTVVWKYVIDAAEGIQGSPTVQGNRAFVCGCDSQLHVIDLDRGTSVAMLELEDPTLATAAVHGSHVYFGTEGGQFLAVDWRQAKIRWTYHHPRSRLAYRSSAAVTGDLVVVGGRDKRVRALVRATGKPAWEFATRGRVDTSPVVASGRVYVGSADGRLYALDLKSGKLVWQYDGGDGFTASPAVAEGRLVIGNDAGVLTCFGDPAPTNDLRTTE